MQKEYSYEKNLTDSLPLASSITRLKFKNWVFFRNGDRMSNRVGEDVKARKRKLIGPRLCLSYILWSRSHISICA